jgi:hypothetical protein
MTSELSMSKNTNTMKELKIEILTGLFLPNSLHSWGIMNSKIPTIKIYIILPNMLKFSRTLETGKL